MKTKEKANTIVDCLRVVQNNLINAMSSSDKKDIRFWELEAMNRLNSCIWKIEDAIKAKATRRLNRKIKCIEINEDKELRRCRD